MWQNMVRITQATEDNIILRMHFACWLIKSTDAPTMQYLSFFYCNIFVCFWGDSPPQWGPRPPHSLGFSITHNGAPHSVGLLWTDDQLVAEISTWQHTTFTTDIHATGGIRTHNLSRRSAADLRLRPRGHCGRPTATVVTRKHLPRSVQPYICNLTSRHFAYRTSRTKCICTLTLSTLLVERIISSIWINRMTTRSRWKFRIRTTTNVLILYSFSSLYIFVTWGRPTVAETCRQPNETDTKTLDRHTNQRTHLNCLH